MRFPAAFCVVLIDPHGDLAAKVAGNRMYFVDYLHQKQQGATNYDLVYINRPEVLPFLFDMLLKNEEFRDFRLRLRGVGDSRAWHADRTRPICLQVPHVL